MFNYLDNLFVNLFFRSSNNKPKKYFGKMITKGLIMAEHNELGKKGEKLAVDFLIENGYKILEKNYRYLKAEVDIIAQIKDILAAVEVKTRSSDYFGNPQDFITPKKIKLLVSAIDYYVVQRDLDVEVRFDVIAVLCKKNDTKIEHLENAFLHF